MHDRGALALLLNPCCTNHMPRKQGCQSSAQDCIISQEVEPLRAPEAREPMPGSRLSPTEYLVSYLATCSLPQTDSSAGTAWTLLSNPLQ